MANNDVIEMEVQEQIAEATGLNEVPEATVFGSEETPNIEIGSLADVVNEEIADENKTEEAKEETMADQVKETEGCTIGAMVEAQKEVGSKENPCTDLSAAKEGMHIRFNCADCGVEVTKVFTKNANVTYCKKCMKKRLAAEQVKVDPESIKVEAATAKAENVIADDPITEKPKAKKVVKVKAKAKTVKAKTVTAKVEKEPSYSILQHIADSFTETGHRIAADMCQLNANYKAFANAYASKQVVLLNRQIERRTECAKELQLKKADHLNSADKLREKWVMYADQKKAEKEAAKVNPATAQ